METLHPTTDPTKPPVRPHTDLANRLATRFAGTYSPRWFAILGAALDHDFGIHLDGSRIVALTITSDGFVIGGTLTLDGSLGHEIFLGDASDLFANLYRFLADVAPGPDVDVIEAAFLRIPDWRPGGNQ